MPYFVSSIIAVVSAMMILFTRYEADDSSITAELDRVKSMFLMIDGFVNTHIQSGGNLTDINFQKLSCSGILSGNIKDTYVAENCDDNEFAGKEDDKASDNVKLYGYSSTLNFPKSDIKWQIIPVRDITANDNDADYGNSAGSAYKILVDMSQNRTLMHKAKFSESFASREYCEKILFGTVQAKGKEYDSTLGKETFKENGTNDDGIFVCIVFK